MPINLPSVAVVIPAWNAGRWLRAAVASALEQTHQVALVVVVDNASTDGSVDSLSFTDARLTVLRLAANRGACAARNLGWRHAVEQSSADWIQFLDADDALKPDKIAVQLAEAEELRDVDVLHSPVIHQVWQADATSPSDEAVQQIDSSRDLISQWLRWEVGQTGALLWKGSALETIGGWNDEQPCCQDNEITLRAIMAGLTFRFAPAAGAIYRHWTEQTLSRKDPAKTLNERARLTLEMVQWLTKQRQALTGEQLETLSEEAYAVARSLAATGPEGLHAAHDWLRQLGGIASIEPRGRACPPSYRLLTRVLGFRGSEKLAARLRDLKH